MTAGITFTKKENEKLKEIEEDLAKPDTRIAIQTSLTRSFDEGQGVTWTTTIPQSASLDEINSIADKIWQASTRQLRLNRVDRIDKEIEYNIQQLAQLQYSLKSLEECHKDWSKAPNDAKVAYNKTKENIIRFTTLIDTLGAEQVRMRKALGL